MAPDGANPVEEATWGQHVLLLPPSAAGPATLGPGLRDRRLRQMEGRACSP